MLKSNEKENENGRLQAVVLGTDAETFLPAFEQHKSIHFPFMREKRSTWH